MPSARALSPQISTEAPKPVDKAAASFQLAPEAELASMKPMREGIVAIDDAERLRRIDKAQHLMREQGVDALYLDVSTNLFYFTGIRLRPSERLHGAIIQAKGDVIYLSPAF